MGINITAVVDREAINFGVCVVCESIYKIIASLCTKVDGRYIWVYNGLIRNKQTTSGPELEGS